MSQDHDRQVGVVRVTGDLSVETIDLFTACARTCLRTSEGVVVDLSGATVPGYPGLWALLSVHREARDGGRRLEVAGVTGTTARLFDAFHAWAVLGGRSSPARTTARAARWTATQDHPVPETSER